MATELDTRTPELAYTTKTNILVPFESNMSAAVVGQEAARHESQLGDAPVVRSRAANSDTLSTQHQAKKALR